MPCYHSQITRMLFCSAHWIIFTTLLSVFIQDRRSVSVNGSTFDIFLNETSVGRNVNGSADVLPKEPNFVSCDPFYGTDLPLLSCQDAVDDMFPGDDRELWFAERTGEGSLQVPLYSVPLVFKDEVYPGCIITIDLAGRTASKAPVDAYSNVLRELAQKVVDKCHKEGGKRQGGFGTVRFTRTVKGIADAKSAPHGYDAPFFITVAVTADKNFKGPGNFDPIVNTKLQAALQQKADTAWLKGSKIKIAIVINALQAAYQKMNISQTFAWWRNIHFQVKIPDHVTNLCRKKLGRPDPADCERASFNFIRTGDTPPITPKKPIFFQYQSCAFEITSDETIKYSWDALRSVADSLLNECMLAESPYPAPKTGGEAAYIGSAVQKTAEISNGNRSISSREADGNTTDASNLDWPKGITMTMKYMDLPRICSSLNSSDCATGGNEGAQTGNQNSSPPLPSESNVVTW